MKKYCILTLLLTWVLPQSFAQHITQKLEKYPGEALVIAFLQNGSMITSAGSDNVLQHWDYKAGKAKRPHQHQGFEHTVDLLPINDEQIATLNKNGEVHLWSLVDGLSKGQLKGLNGKITAICYHQPSQTIYAGDEYSNVGGWNMKTGEMVLEFSTGNPLTCMQVSPDGSLLLTASNQSGIRGWNTQNGRQEFIAQSPRHHYKTLSFSPDSRKMAAGDTEGNIYILNAKNGQVLQSMDSHTGIIRDLIFHPTAPLLISASDDHKIHFWHTETGREINVHEAKGKGNFSIAKHPTEDILAVVSAGNSQPYLINFQAQVKAAQNLSSTPQEDTDALSGFPATLHGREVKKQASITVKEQTIKIKIYDGKSEDGDIISLYFNGELLIAEQEMQKKPLKMDIELKRGQSNSLILYAHNLGKIPPNTATIEVKGQKEIYELRSGLGSCGALEFVLEDN